jgi:hypothetical protein
VSSDPARDERDPAAAIDALVDRTLALAATWPAWDGRPIEVDSPDPADGTRVYTPHKAIRRVADHLIDHLAELEARLAGAPTLPDHWHGSFITTAADLAPFTGDDLDEARSRLIRLGQIWRLRLRALDAERLDRPEGDAWTLRRVALHVAGTYYVDSVGDLGATVGHGR